MLTERPVVATGPEGVVDLLADGGGAIIRPENDPAALAAVLREYGTDGELRDRHGREARRVAENLHASGSVAERFEMLLRAVRDRSDADRPG